jgi:hypothetical protein
MPMLSSQSALATGSESTQDAGMVSLKARERVGMLAQA